MATPFQRDDHGYLAWLTANPAGYVLNTRRRPDPAYMVLHRATCLAIQTPSAAPGAWTERSYQKVRATAVADLAAWARANGRRDGSFSRICSRCRAV